jgi:hypothetical protein
MTLNFGFFLGIGLILGLLDELLVDDEEDGGTTEYRGRVAEDDDEDDEGTSEYRGRADEDDDEDDDGISGYRGGAEEDDVEARDEELEEFVEGRDSLG